MPDSKNNGNGQTGVIEKTFQTEGARDMAKEGCTLHRGPSVITAERAGGQKPSMEAETEINIKALYSASRKVA